MKERYIDLMEKALAAYTDAHVQQYFDEVKSEGLTEHGFPRLTANLGILIAHGKRTHLLPLFTEMMSFCCKMFLRPYAKSANEFSVREVLCCIAELEIAAVVDDAILQRWKRDLAAIEPDKCYDSFKDALSNQTRNWALFLSVSELFRENAGLCASSALIDSILQHQLQWFDENGMYRDNKYEENHQPIMYDIATRGLCCLLLHFGYQGKYRRQIDAYLKKAAWLTLQMQSPTGEIAFGGRSNQYLLCEGWQAQIFEYEAIRYAAAGDWETAAVFKRAAVKSVEVCEKWISLSPISHIKNRFPAETRFGCEGYGYFNKYMITVASNFYVAYLICKEDLPVAENIPRPPYTLKTSDYFHKLFLGTETYQLEFDLNADPHYDANGLGRVQHAQAPSTVCLSCPCPPEQGYYVGSQARFAFSLCPAVPTKDGWMFGAEKSAKYVVLNTASCTDSASATMLCIFPDNRAIQEHYTVEERGVSVKIEGTGEVGYSLPAFCFDGEASTNIALGEHWLTVSYKGWQCRYTTDGAILDLNKIAVNRNGHYRAFLAAAQNALNIKIEIMPL